MDGIKSMKEKTSIEGTQLTCFKLTLWRRNYFFLILAHPVYKM